MSEIKLINLKTKKDLKTKKIEILDFSHDLFEVIKKSLGLTVLKQNFTFLDEKINYLLLDENKTITLLDFKKENFGQILGRSLYLVDLIRENLGKLKTYLSEDLKKEEILEIDFNPRIIVLGTNFTKYDHYAIKQINKEIDLIKCEVFDSNTLVLEKNYQSQNYLENGFPKSQVFNEIKEHLLMLGDEIVIKEFPHYVAIRRITNFAYLYYDEALVLRVLVDGKYKTKAIKNSKDLETALKLLEEAYA